MLHTPAYNRMKCPSLVLDTGKMICDLRLSQEDRPADVTANSTVICHVVAVSQLTNVEECFTKQCSIQTRQLLKFQVYNLQQSYGSNNNHAIRGTVKKKLAICNHCPKCVGSLGIDSTKLCGRKRICSSKSSNLGPKFM